MLMCQEDALYRIKKGISGSSAKIWPDSPDEAHAGAWHSSFLLYLLIVFFQGKNTLKYHPHYPRRCFMKRPLRIGKQSGFLAALVLLAISAVNAQEIKVGAPVTVYGSDYLNSIFTQNPWGKCSGLDYRFYFDAPCFALRNTNGTINLYASSWQGIDIFQNSTALNPLNTKAPKNIPDAAPDYLTPNPDGDRVWEFRQDISSNQLPQYRATDALLIRKDMGFCFKHDCTINMYYPGSVTFTHPLASPRPELSPPPDPQSDQGWANDYTWIPHVYKIEQRDIPIPNPYGIVAGDLIGFVHVETWTITRNVDVFSIGVAYARSKTDAGGYKRYTNWVYCGDIIRDRTNSSPGTNNIAGAPYIDKRNSDASKDTFYVYFNDYDNNTWYSTKDWQRKRACVARANKRSVLTNAAQIYSNWENYQEPMTLNYDFRKLTSTGSWDATDAIQSYSLPKDLLPVSTRPNPVPDLHSSAVWCNPLNQCLMTV
jgi:hypothetical protein